MSRSSKFKSSFILRPSDRASSPRQPHSAFSISDDVYKPEHPIIQGVTACSADDKVTPCFLEAISYLVAGSSRRRRTRKDDSGGRNQLAGEVVQKRLLHLCLGIDDEIALAVSNQVLQILGSRAEVGVANVNWA